MKNLLFRLLAASSELELPVFTKARSVGLRASAQCAAAAQCHEISAPRGANPVGCLGSHAEFVRHGPLSKI